VGGSNGSLHVYDWEPGALQEIAVLFYPRIFSEPHPITFSFVHGSHFLLVGSEEDEALLFNTVNKREIAILKHQSKWLLNLYSINFLLLIEGCHIRAVAVSGILYYVFSPFTLIAGMGKYGTSFLLYWFISHKNVHCCLGV
jgi:hypothetical protein